MKHEINLVTYKCDLCGLSSHQAHRVKCRGTHDNSDQEIGNQPRMQRAANGLDEAKQFTDKLKALGEELGFTVIEVNHPDEYVQEVDSISAMLEFAELFMQGKKEQAEPESSHVYLKTEELDLLKLLAEKPMSVGHIGTLQLPLEHIQIMCEFKRNNLIANQVIHGVNYWCISAKGATVLDKYSKPKATTLTLDQLCALTHMYHAQTWDLNDVLEYQAQDDVNALMDHGLVRYRKMTGDWILTQAGANHIDKLLALTV